MTEARNKSASVLHGGQKRRKRTVGLRLSLSEGMTVLLSALLLWFVLRDAGAAVDAAYTGLVLLSRSVIPALFPFLVLSSLLASSGAGERLGRILSRPMRFLFGVSGNGAAAILLGAFCGFPVGARIVSTLYGRGALSRAEAERLLALSNAPSFAFLYSAVGAGAFRDRDFGLRLYVSVMLSVLLSGLALRAMHGTCDLPEKVCTALPNERQSVSALVVSAVRGAGETMLTVSAFVVFFSVLSEALSALLCACGAPRLLSLLSSGILELSCGTKKAAETVYGLCGRVLCGFYAGWGGLCAHLQVIATAERPLPDRARGKSLSFRSYFVCKGIQGLLSALFVWLSYLFF